MAESKTRARRSGGTKAGKGSAKDGEAARPAAQEGKPASTAKSTDAGAKPAKPAAKRPKVAAKPAKVTARTAKASAASGKAARAPAKGASAAAKAAKPAAARPAARRKAVQDAARSYFDAVAARDAAGVAAHWHREGIYDSVPLGVFRGPEAVRRHYEETFTAMPDMRITVERITADDRVAAVQWRASGTFSGGPFQGIEPTGRRVELRGTDCLEVEDGKVMRNTSAYDGAAVARGMGLLPPEDSGADRAIRAGVNTVTKLRRAMAGRIGGSR